MTAVHELERLYRERLRERPGAELREVPWLLEELRVSQFAQGVGVRGNVSSKRVRRLLDDPAARN
jgi:ATP-dependent helicase HrpA